MTAEIAVTRATNADFEVVKAWLADAGLPTEDLVPDHIARFLVARCDEESVGTVGLEIAGSRGLLRSLVVSPGARGAGVGRRLVEALEIEAMATDIAELWLLTIDADSFFAQLGYVAAGRDEAPDAIRNTMEFSTLCPGDAVLMRKQLG